MINQFSRTALLVGNDGLSKLNNSKVAVFGIGGVGSYTAEALARSGVGTLVLVDNDIVSTTNINRQIIALHSTVGKYKVDVMKQRILDINPDAQVITHKTFYLPGEDDEIITGCDYVVDAIDTVAGKMGLVQACNDKNIPIISSMGCGNKLDPSRFAVTDIYKTEGCPLARVMRRELKKKGIKSLKVVFSSEPPCKQYTNIEIEKIDDNSSRRQLPGSIAFVPSVAGLMVAGEVIRDIITD